MITYDFKRTFGDNFPYFEYPGTSFVIFLKVGGLKLPILQTLCVFHLFLLILHLKHIKHNFEIFFSILMHF